MTETEKLLEVDSLFTNFYTYQGVVKALDSVSFSILKGETLGLVGETGCGKSVTANCILGLLPIPPGKIESGSIYFRPPSGTDGEIASLRKETEALKADPSLKAGDARLKRLESDMAELTELRRISDEIRRLESAPDAGERGQQLNDLRAQRRKILSRYDLLVKSKDYMRKIRGKYISMIFQEPMSALNPVITVGNQISETLLLHEKKELANASIRKMEAEIRDNKQLSSYKKSRMNSTIRKYKKMVADPNNLSLRIQSRVPVVRRYEDPIKKEAMDRAEAMLRLVRIPDPGNVISSYPHELSGGMQQRVMIAMALSCRPQMLIADEPTTALDVTIQAQILKLMKDLQEETGTSILLITHNLGVVAETCSRVGVMYAGSMAEIGPVNSIFKEPLHPYTQGLMNSIPNVTISSGRLETIEGNVPNLINPPPGCRFNTRCPYAMDVCHKDKPELQEIRPNHFVACHLYRGGEQ